MRFLNTLFKKPALLVLACLSVNFVAATVVSTSPPSSEVKVQSYAYSGSTFSGKIYVSLHNFCKHDVLNTPFFLQIKNIAYSKTVSVVYSDASDNWNNNGNVIAATYSGGIDGTNYEFWTFSGSISGIKQFYVKVI